MLVKVVGRGRFRIRQDSKSQVTANSVEMAIGGAESKSLSGRRLKRKLQLNAIEKWTGDGQTKVRGRRRRRRRRRRSERRAIS
jgi:hypothetical protein